MKKLSVFSAWMMSILLMLGFANGKAIAQAGDVVVHAATVDITHFPGTEPIDQIDMTATVTLKLCTDSRPSDVKPTDPTSSVLHAVLTPI